MGKDCNMLPSVDTITSNRNAYLTVATVTYVLVVMATCVLTVLVVRDLL